MNEHPRDLDAPRQDAGESRPEAPLALDLSGITRRFGRRWVLRGASLKVEAGEVVALVGRNGSGKTTLLRVISTALRPNHGRGTVFGAELGAEADQVREHVGLLGHSPGIYDDLTALENLHFAQRMTGQRVDSVAALWALEQVDLAREAEETVRGFSSGMRRRVALARLLLRPPRLLLLDEPFASFDVDGIERLFAFIRSCSAAGGAVILATHDLPRASRVLTRVVEIQEGRLVELPVKGDQGVTPLFYAEGGA